MVAMSSSSGVSVSVSVPTADGRINTRITSLVRLIRSSICSAPVKLGALTLVLGFLAVWGYSWKRRRDLVLRVLDAAIRGFHIGSTEDAVHLRSRLGTREKCNLYKTIPNFRDISASDCADVLGERSRLRSRINGKRVNRGLIYRSSNVLSASVKVEELDQLLFQRVKRVLDLRGPSERSEDSSKYRHKLGDSVNSKNGNGNGNGNGDSKGGEKGLLGVSLTPLSVLISLAPVTVQIRLAILLLFRSPKIQSDFSHCIQALIMKHKNQLGLRGMAYLTLEHSQKLLFKILQTVTFTPEPVLIQCQCGKDATGLISALILGAIGISDSDIVHNYQMSTALLNKDWCQARLQKASFAGGIGIGIDSVFYFSSPPGVMEHILEYLENYYGGIESYLDTIGFDSYLRQKLQDKLLV